MSMFPYVTPLDEKVVKAITNTDKSKFSGTKAFAVLQAYGNGEPFPIIGNNEYYKFDFATSYANHTNRIYYSLLLFIK